MFIHVPSRPGLSARVRLPSAEWKQQPWPQDELRNASRKFYSFDSRGLKRGRTQAELYAITRRWLTRFAGVTVVLWLLAMILLTADYAIDVMPWALGIVFVASLFDKFFFDFIGLAAGLDLVSKDFAEARWDLICLSDASMVELVRSKAVIAQIRAWRAMLVAIGLRISVVVQGLLWLFVSPFFTGGNWYDNGIYAITTINSFSDFITVISVTFSVVVLAGAYLVEPRWRLRALAAASVRSSAYAKDTTGGLMRIGGAFLRLSLAQAGTGFILMFALSFSGGFVGVLSAGGIVAVLFFWVLYTIFAAWMIRATYVGFARRRLNEAFISLIRRGGSF